MRCFVALPLPDQMKEGLASGIALLKSAFGGGRASGRKPPFDGRRAFDGGKAFGWEGSFGPGSELRWTDPRSWHITLAFLGELSPEEVELARAALLPLGSFPVFELRAEGLLILPPRGEPRVLALRIGLGADRVQALWRTYNEGLRERETEAGCRPLNGEYRAGGRPFLAHATLARFAAPARGPSPGRGTLGDFSAQMKATGRAASCILYRSDLTSAGAVHAALESVDLREEA